MWEYKIIMKNGDRFKFKCGLNISEIFEEAFKREVPFIRAENYIINVAEIAYIKQCNKIVKTEDEYDDYGQII